MNRETIRNLAKSGRLDFLPSHLIKKALITGRLSNGYSVHHIRFKSLGGHNSIDNYIVLKDKDHRAIHRHHDINGNIDEVTTRYTSAYFRKLVTSFLDKKDKKYYNVNMRVIIENNKREYNNTKTIKKHYGMEK